MQLKLVHFEFQSSHLAFFHSPPLAASRPSVAGDVMAATVLLQIVNYSKGQFSWL